MRQLIRFDNRWQAEAQAENRVRVFVPAPWRGQRAVLQPARGQEWSEVQMGGEPLQPDENGEGWVGPQSIQLGTWNEVQVSGTVEGGRMVASSGLFICTLEADLATERSLSIRTRLSMEGAVTLFFTLTDPDGRQVGAQEVQVSRRARALTVELHAKEELKGRHRLKAVLMIGDRILDNARIDIDL